MFFFCLKGLCANELLLDILCNSKVEATYVEREHQICFSFKTTDGCRTKFAKIIADMLEPSALLKTLLKEYIRSELKISLTFIDAFIQQCIKLIDAEKQKLLDKDLGLSDASLQVEKYKVRVLGCQIKCPCCGRMCDVEHYDATRSESLNAQKVNPIGSGTNKHRCRRGHQLRAMGGFKMAPTNEPSFRICESMKDLDRIVYNGKNIYWKEFKDFFPKWSFEVDSLQDASKWRTRLVFIWDKVGKELCDHFEMKFTSPVITDPSCIGQIRIDGRHALECSNQFS